MEIKDEEKGEEIVKIELHSRDKQEIVHMATESEKNSLSFSHAGTRDINENQTMSSQVHLYYRAELNTQREVEGE